MFLIFALMTLIIGCNTFVNNPIISYIRKFENKLENIKVTELQNVDKLCTRCIIFFTGGSSLIIPEIYNNFFSKLVDNNFSIYTPSFRYSNISKLINTIKDDYIEIILVGHSSGCTTAINNCNNSFINKLILLDAVDTRLINRNKNYDLKNLESILFLNAMKSYKITYDPYGFPFIPFLRIKKNNFNLKNDCQIININIEDYGHCDILDKPFSNVMHKTRIAVGNRNRTYTNLNNYHIWNANIFRNFVNKDYNFTINI